MDYSAMWKAVATAFNALDTGFTTSGRSRGWFMWVKNPPGFVPDLGGNGIHYEWLYKEPGKLLVALHFETSSAAENQRLYQAVLAKDSIRDGIDYPFSYGISKGHWREIEFLITPIAEESLQDTAGRAAQVMKTLIEQSSHILRGEKR